MSLSKNRLLCIWLSSAALVTLIRVLNAANLGELPIQIQAGQHLVAGKGLSVFSSPGEDDLAAPARLVSLAHYPAGYSVYAAALLGVGIGIPTLVKLFFALTTMWGWWGWGILSYHYFADGLRRGRRWTLAAVIIAACTPILYTMLWKGTDTFLWAAIPWVLLLVTNAAKENRPRRWWLDVVAGLLSGLSFVMRYAALLLVVYSLVLIVCQSFARPKTLGSRIGSFAAGLLPFLIPQICFTLFSSDAELIPDIFTLKGSGLAIVRRIGNGIPFLGSANICVGWWMPHQFVAFLTQTGRHSLWLISIAGFGWALLPGILSRRIGCHSLGEAAGDVRTAATGLLLAFPLFLLGWTGVAEYMYVVESRYYLPAIPLVIFIAYQLASPSPGQNQSAVERWSGKAALVYLAGYIAMGIFSLGRLPFPGTIGEKSRIKLMGMLPAQVHWPAAKLSYDFSPGRDYIVKVVGEKPDTVLVTNHEEWFYADPRLDQARIRRLKDLQATYVSGPARVIIAIQDHAPGPLTSVAWYGHYDQRWTAEYFGNLTNVRLLQTFPREEIRVVEATVAEGERVPLKKGTAQIRNF